jgi:hypothetical protein
MYGANNLVWQGVQNATIGTIYTTEYGFSTAAISAAYAGGVLGTIIGSVYVYRPLKDGYGSRRTELRS